MAGLGGEGVPDCYLSLRGRFGAPHLGLANRYMPPLFYREAHLGIRIRLEELSMRVRELESQLTDAFWSSLELYVRERLAELREGLAMVAAESLAEQTRAEGLLAAYVDELTRWVATAHAREDSWRELPSMVDDPPPPSHPFAYGLAAPSRADFVRSFASTMYDVCHETEVVEDGRRSFFARFRRRDAPFSLRATPIADARGQLREVEMQLVTSVPRGAPRLSVRHESLFAAVSKAMGFKHEVEVGDESFDGLFLVQGNRLDARRVLVPIVRAHLLALARFDVPTLEVDPNLREASLSWCFEPAVAAIEAAIRALLCIRDTPPVIAFRRT